jgi:hypothetical protein
MELKMKEETFITVEYSDLDAFITKHFFFAREKGLMDKYSPEPEDGVYLKEFEFVAVEEAANDSSYTFSVTGKQDKWDEEEMKEILERKDFGSFTTRRILNYLASKDLIPKGNYLINVCW